MPLLILTELGLKAKYCAMMHLQVQTLRQKAELKLLENQNKMSKLFNKDQLAALSRRSTRGLKWELNTIKKSLKLRFSCGSTGYQELITMGMPLPSIRTLQRKVKGIGFSHGILHSVFNYLGPKVSFWQNSLLHSKLSV